MARRRRQANGGRPKAVPEPDLHLHERSFHSGNMISNPLRREAERAWPEPTAQPRIDSAKPAPDPVPNPIGNFLRSERTSRFASSKASSSKHVKNCTSSAFIQSSSRRISSRGARSSKKASA